MKDLDSTAMNVLNNIDETDNYRSTKLKSMDRKNLEGHIIRQFTRCLTCKSSTLEKLQFETFYF